MVLQAVGRDNQRREVMMRIPVIAAIAAIGFGCIGISGASATPVSGTVIKDSAAKSSLVQDVRWYGRRWGYRRGWGYHRGWCYYHPYRCGRW